MIKDIIDANNNVTVGAKEIEILKELSQLASVTVHLISSG